MNQVSEGDNGGGNGAQTPPPASQTQTEGDSLSATLDEMYKDEPTPPPAKVEDKPTQEATKDEKKPDGETAPSLTGYGDEPSQAADGDGKTPEKKEEKPAEEGVKVEFDATGLDDSNKTYVENFAKEHKLSKETTQAFANQIKAQNKVIADVADTYMKLQKQAQEATHKAWEDELKNDANFGGANFQRNLKRVDTVLDKLFPNAKIYLQNSKERLHPSAMKDLLSFYDSVLGGDSKIVNPETGAKEGEFDLDEFYK